MRRNRLALALAVAGCGSSAPGRAVRQARPRNAAARAGAAAARPALTGRPSPAADTAGWSRWSPPRPGTACSMLSVPGSGCCARSRCRASRSTWPGPAPTVRSRWSVPAARRSVCSAGRGCAASGCPGDWSRRTSPSMAPGGDFVYVTDDGSGRADVIGLARRRIVSRTLRRYSAPTTSPSVPTGQQVWVVLGQAAHTVAILSTASRPPPGRHRRQLGQPGRPRVVGHFDPGYRAHDIKFTPDGRSVWITSASGSTIGVFDARTHRLRLRIPAGAPPQHVVFGGSFCLRDQRLRLHHRADPLAHRAGRAPGPCPVRILRARRGRTAMSSRRRCCAEPWPSMTATSESCGSGVSAATRGGRRPGRPLVRTDRADHDQLVAIVARGHPDRAGVASDDRVAEALVEALDAQAAADGQGQMLEPQLGRQPVQPFEQDPAGAGPLQSPGRPSGAARCASGRAAASRR